MKHRPRVGLVFLAAEWFWQQNIQRGTGRYKDLSRCVEEDAEAIRNRLGQRLEVCRTSILHTEEGAKEEMAKLRSEPVDLLVLCSIIWSEDAPLMQVLEAAGDVPLAVWCYSPAERLPARVSMEELFRRSGTVGTLQHSAVLKRRKKTFGFVFGSLENPAAMEQIGDYAEAASAVKAMKGSVIGLLPSRCEVMTGTHVDEFRLRTEAGPRVRYISVAEYASHIERVTAAETGDFLRYLRERYPICGVDDVNLSAAAKASLGLAKLAEELKLDAVAINDLSEELHRIVKVRPFLCVPEFFEAGRVMGMEGDLATTSGMRILRQLQDAPVMYTEIFTYDESLNAVLMGHAGMHDVRLAGSEVRITPDYEYCESGEYSGAWMEFRGRSGRVTLASFFSDTDGFKVVTAGGTSLEEGPVLEGFAHVLVRPDVPLESFFEPIVRTGLTQHWVVCHGDVRGRLEKMAGMCGWKCQMVE